ncbi:MAG: hypothetical protein CMJ18_23535 [Phycisphaeraceae bacterium]|nr:hypothetical protein [Phycisphaeraceae bacterium]
MADRTAGQTRRICLERVETLYSDGRWNGRPTFVHWRDTWYIAFRSAQSHEGHGKVMMLTSKDLESWKVSTVIDDPDIDGAEPMLLAIDDRLFLYIVAEEPATTSFMTCSEDGVDWPKPVPFYEPGFSVNTPVSHKGVHYMAIDKGHVELIRSSDGFEWSRISKIVDGATETALVFLKDDTLIAVTRQAKFARASPPYTDWEIVEHDPVALGLGGPDAALVGDTVLVAGRLFAQTVLLKLHPDTLDLDKLMDMPVHHVEGCVCGSISETLADTEIASAEPHVWPHGDKAYPEFLVLDDRQVLMAYYDGQAFEPGVPKRADIRLARFTVD